MVKLEDLKPGLPLVGLEPSSVATVAAVVPIEDRAASQSPCEAKRIDLASLIDPKMAVRTSNVDPLPYPITAVHESMLPPQPIRFVLDDDPEASLGRGPRQKGGAW